MTDGGVIPRELRDRPQWVLYRVAQRNGRATKVPYQPAHPRRLASATDSSTWATFEVAIAAAEKSAAIGAGVGFVFTAADPFVGIDLDACRDPITGEVHPAAARIVTSLHSYTEVSPSGRGLHVIGRGVFGGGRRTSDTPWGGELEVYDRDRYFTITGDVCQIGRAGVNVG